jgi:ankyrin repeat protein
MKNDSTQRAHRLEFFSDLSNGRVPEALKKFPEWASAPVAINGETPLHIVMGSNARTVGQIDALLDCGADVNAKNEDAKTPLALVMERAGAITGIERLIDRGADIWGKDPGDTASWSFLHHCAQKQMIAEAHLLIQKGGRALLENEGPDGMRPLHVAAENLNLSSVRMLLGWGADVHALNAHGLSAAQIALEQKSVNMNFEHRVLLALLAHGANPDHCGHYRSCTPEMAAAGLGDIDRLVAIRQQRETMGNPMSISQMRAATEFAKGLGALEVASLLDSWMAAAAIDLINQEGRPQTASKTRSHAP